MNIKVQKAGEGGCLNVEAIEEGAYNWNMIAKSRKKRVSKSKSLQTAEIQAAMDYGIDISMLIQNVKRSCTERIIRHQIALNIIEKLRKARRL